MMSDKEFKAKIKAMTNREIIKGLREAARGEGDACRDLLLVAADRMEELENYREEMINQ